MQIICKFVTYVVYACNKLLQYYITLSANRTQVNLCAYVKSTYGVFA